MIANKDEKIRRDSFTRSPRPRRHPKTAETKRACVAGGKGSIVNHMVKCSPRLLSLTFAALADPTRRRILAHLALGERCVTELARPYSMSLPAVSKHVRVLENVGLVRRRRRGRVHSIRLQAAPMERASQWIGEYRRFWEGSLDRLDGYLKGLQARDEQS
jgi:DNA-binding transcriptional ArsR family regulator